MVGLRNSDATALETFFKECRLAGLAVGPHDVPTDEGGLYYGWVEARPVTEDDNRWLAMGQYSDGSPCLWTMDLKGAIKFDTMAEMLEAANKEIAKW